MPLLRFRSSFSVRTRLGSRRRYLNKRTATKEEKKLPPILIVDLDYIHSLLSSRQKSKASKYYNSTNLLPLFYTWLTSIFNLITPSGIIFIAEQENEFTKNLVYPIIYADIKNYIYTIKANHLLSEPLVITTNNIGVWSLSSNSANISFIAIDTNNRIMHYNNKTGLEIVSKFIGTYKIINKLGLANLKYLNLQYLFILIYYLSITNKSEDDFYFDGTYFRNLDKYDKPFLKSNGLGLSLVSDAHKFLSYAFLTKPEFLDFFLMGNADHYELQLSRLAKLLPIDIQVLNKLKQQYDKMYLPTLLSNAVLPKITPNLPGALSIYSDIWNKRNRSTVYAEHKDYAKHIRKFTAYTNYDVSALIETLPTGLKKDLAVTRHTPVKEKTDTSDIEDYVSNLIAGAF
jgi:hypothetical protein